MILQTLVQQITPNTPMIHHFQTNLRQKMLSTKCPSKKILLISANVRISKNNLKTIKKSPDKDISKNLFNGSVEGTRDSK